MPLMWIFSSFMIITFFFGMVVFFGESMLAHESGYNQKSLGEMEWSW